MSACVGQTMPPVERAAGSGRRRAEVLTPRRHDQALGLLHLRPDVHGLGLLLHRVEAVVVLLVCPLLVLQQRERLLLAALGRLPVDVQLAQRFALLPQRVVEGLDLVAHLALGLLLLLALLLLGGDARLLRLAREALGLGLGLGGLDGLVVHLVERHQLDVERLLRLLDDRQGLDEVEDRLVAAPLAHPLGVGAALALQARRHHRRQARRARRRVALADVHQQLEQRQVAVDGAGVQRGHARKGADRFGVIRFGSLLLQVLDDGVVVRRAPFAHAVDAPRARREDARQGRLGLVLRAIEGLDGRRVAAVGPQTEGVAREECDELLGYHLFLLLLVLGVVGHRWLARGATLWCGSPGSAIPSLVDPSRLERPRSGWDYLPAAVIRCCCIFLRAGWGSVRTVGGPIYRDALRRAAHRFKPLK